MDVDDLVHDLGDRLAVGGGVLEDLRRPAIQPVSQFLDGLHVAGRSLFDVRPCDLAQLLQVYAFAHIGELEAQSFAIDLIALLTAGVSGYVAVAHFGWSTRWFHVKFRKCVSLPPRSLGRWLLLFAFVHLPLTSVRPFLCF